MSDPKHTPGPWAMQDRLCARVVSGIDIRSEPTGDIVTRLPDGASTTGGHCFPRQLANARLMAAAPELLEACNAMLGLLVDARNGIDEHGGDSSFVDEIEGHARAAIAKAETTP